MVTNWAGNVTFQAARVHRPTSVAEVQDIVANSPRVRAMGTGHSFSRIADTDGDLVSLAGLAPVMDIDADQATVTVAAGVRYGELAEHLHAAGYALRNLASLPHISVAGACATATHGSGNGIGNLATAVTGLQMVTGSGELVTVTRDKDPDQFAGAVVSLGCLGIVTSLTLEIIPTFEVRQYVYEHLPRRRLTESFDEVFASGYSVSLFTDWTSGDINQVWVKRRSDDDTAAPSSWLDAKLADGPRHPVSGMPTSNCTQQLGVPGPWHTRLPHFRLEYTPSSGEELQSEYFVERDHALDALEALNRIRDRIAPVLQICEIRTIAADDLWLSPHYRRDSVGIHFTWVADEAAVTPVIAAIEEQLAPFAPRPHWAKLYGMDPGTVAACYERMPDFVRLCREFDPSGKFQPSIPLL